MALYNIYGLTSNFQFFLHVDIYKKLFIFFKGDISSLPTQTLIAARSSEMGFDFDRHIM